MDIHLHAQGDALPDSLRRHAVRRLRFALARLRNRIVAVRLELRDVNGPRGGVDKQVCLRVQLDRGPAAVVSDTHSRWTDLIDRVADRAVRVVLRRTQRSRQAMRPPRGYDTPDAAARVLVLAIVADGRLGACEVQALDDADAYARLGLDRDGFYRVMRAVCADLLDRQCATGDSMFKLDGPVAQAWIDQVRTPRLRQTVLELAFEVIRSDGVLHPGESRIFWQAMDRWGLRLDDVRAARQMGTGSAPTPDRGLPPPPRVHRVARPMGVPG